MEKKSRTEMLSGKRDFYRCCKARRSISHVNKEFRQQFQNYAPPSLRVIRTKFTRTIIIIYTKYSTLPSGISEYIVPKLGIFLEAGGLGKYSLPRVYNICRYFTRKGLNI